MTETAAWPFGTDADQDDPLTALRVPAVSSFNPGWRYVAAYLKPVTDGPDYLKGPPFGSNERPTDREARMLASFIREYIEHWFNEGYQAKLARRPLDVDSGCKTIVFIKYGEDDWGYRNVEWRYGPTFVPSPPNSRGTEHEYSKRPGPLSLVQVMDRVHTIGDGPMEHWLNWKAAHPEVFGPDSGPDEVVAFTVGSLWYCPACAQGQPVRIPEPRRNLMDVYTYHCDQCRKPIR